MSEDYTPTTWEVRAAYMRDGYSGDAFDLWLARVKADAFSEGVNFIDNDPSPSWGGSMVAGRYEAARRRAATEPAKEDA